MPNLKHFLRLSLVLIFSKQSIDLPRFAVGKSAWPELARGGRGGGGDNRLANACKFDNAISVGVRQRGEWIR